MAPFQVEFIRFNQAGAEDVVVRRALQAQTVFDAEREALRERGEGKALLVNEFDTAFLCREGPRVRRYVKSAAGFARWQRA